MKIFLNGEESRYHFVGTDVFNDRGKLIKPILWSGKRYMMYSFNHKGKKVRVLAHRLLAEYFLNLADYQTVNHKNGNGLDNDLSNLEVISLEGNIKHAFNTGLSKGSPYRKIKFFKDGKLVYTFDSINQATKAGFNAGNIHSALERGHKVKGFTVEEVI